MTYIVLIVIIIILLLGIRLVNQYERGVVFRLGKVQSNIKQPGAKADYSASRPDAKSQPAHSDLTD